MSGRSTQHATFVIERIFRVAPIAVYAAWADPAAKQRWFGGDEAWTEQEREFDFRVGGRERVQGTWHNGPVSAFDCLYQDIVPDERIVYSYDMHLDGKRISVSLATVEFKADPAGTRMIFTEQGVFLDGYDDADARERGTRGLMDRLEALLRTG